MSISSNDLRLIKLRKRGSIVVYPNTVLADLAYEYYVDRQRDKDADRIFFDQTAPKGVDTEIEKLLDRQGWSWEKEVNIAEGQTLYVMQRDLEEKPQGELLINIIPDG